MISRLTFQQRNFALLSILLGVTMIVIWMVVHPRYKASVIEERTTIIEQMQTYAIGSLDEQIAAWTSVTRYVAWQVVERPKEGESLVRSITTLNPEIIRIRIHSDKLADELTSQNVNYPNINISVADNQWFPSKLDSSIQVAWFRSLNPDVHLMVFKKTFRIDEIDFTLTILWDAKKLSRQFERFPVGDGYSVSLLTERVVVFENQSDFHPGLVHPSASETHRVQVVRQDDSGWRVLTSEFRSIGLWMVVAVPEPVVLEPVSRLFLSTSLAIAGLFLLLMSAGWVLTRQIVRPVAQLTEDISRLSTLDFSKEIRIPTVPDLRTMGGTVESMRHALDRYQKMNVEKIIFEEWKNRFFMVHGEDMIGIVDSEGRFVFKNDKLSEFCRELWPNVQVDFRQQVLESPRITRTKETSRTEPAGEHSVSQTTAEIRVTQPDGEPYYFRMQDVSISRGDESLGSMIIFHDLTTDRQIDKMKTDMINIVVHELRNPLGSIMGFTQILLDDKNLTMDEKKEFLGLIGTSSKNLNQLVNRFLDISRLESRRVEYTKHPADLVEIVKLLLDTQRPQLTNKDLKAEFEFDADLPPVTVAPDLMREAFMNLVSNAIKYGDPGRTINVTLRRNGDNAVFAIVDHGYGIPPEAQKKLFTKFYRVTSNVKAAAEVGTGLGLAHVKEIAIFHGGSVTLESNPEIGCKFTVTLPLDRES